MKIIIALLAILSFHPWMGAQDKPGIPGPVISAIREADASKLADHFNKTIELSLPGQENTFSASQGEMIMKDFFKKSPPDSFTVIREGTTDEISLYAICSYQSGDMNYQVYLFMKKTDDRYLIQKLSIEEKK